MGIRGYNRVYMGIFGILGIKGYIREYFGKYGYIRYILVYKGI